MATYRWLPAGASWVIGFVAGLTFALCPVMGGWSNGEEPAAQATRAGALGQPTHIRVQHGRLSVSLRSADVRQVVAEIGQLAGIPVLLGGVPERQVSAEFTDVALEEGLRRLLRLAALNHTMLFAQGPAGELTMTKVVIFGPEPGGVALASAAAEADRGAGSDEGSQPLLDTTIPGHAASPADDTAASTVMLHIQEALARSREPRHQPVDGNGSEAVRRVREAIGHAIHAQKESASLPQTADEIMALIPGTLGGMAPFAIDPGGSGTPAPLNSLAGGGTPAP